MKILAIDDNTDNLVALRAVVSDAFPGAGFLTAPDGPGGIAAALAEDPDVILLDIIMPKMDGFEVCRRLKADGRLRHIPVVFLTALETGRESRVKALEIGAEAFLSKPIEEVELTAQIRAMAKIKTATVLQKQENERLAMMVAERTREIDRKLALQRKTEAALQKTLQSLQLSQTAALNVMEDLKEENEARKKIEEALRVEQGRLDLAVTATALGLYDWNPKTGAVLFSDLWAVMFGYRVDELPAHFSAWSERVHPDDLPVTRKATQDAFRDDTPYICEYRMRHRDGSWRWILDQGRIVARDAQGEVIRFVGANLDITERKQVEEALAQEAALLAQAEAISHMGSWRMVLETGRVNWSDEMYRIFGLDRTTFSQRVSEAIALAVHPEDRAKLDELNSAVLRDGLPRPLDYRIVHPDGTVRWVHTQGEQERDETGRVVALAGFVQDITERKRLEEALAHEREELARSNAELEQFAYVASHDLQEPVRMVSSYVQLLTRRYQGKLDRDADEFIGFAADGVARMQQMIVDLLALSRLGTRGQQFAAVPCDGVLDQALANLQTAIQESKAKIRRDPLPTVMADYTRLVQLFQNLIGNALKFRGKKTPRVHISAELHAEAWVFSVRDNGIGIDPKYAERIFVLFQRLHGRSAYAGTGIGLAICKKIVGQHGGRIWVESQLNKGSTFYFSLPIAMSSHKEGDRR